MVLTECDVIASAQSGGNELQVAVEFARLLSGSRRASLMASHNRAEALRIIVSSGVPFIIAARARVPLGTAIAGRVAQSNRPVLKNGRSPRNRRVSYSSDSFISVPLVLPGMAYAVLNVADPEARKGFDKEDLATLQQFGTSLVEGLSSGESHKYLQRLHRQSRLFHRRMIEAREDERNRIGRELHDATGDILTRAVLKLENDIARLPIEDGATREALQHAWATLRESGDTLHEAVLNLRPTALDTQGLVGALHSLADASLTLSGYIVSIKVDDRAHLFDSGSTVLDEATELTFYRIAQEALTNVRKHAQPTQAWVRLEAHPRSIVLTISDNGVGLPPDAVRADGERAMPQLGLTGMRERAEALGGTLKIQARDGGGTSVSIRVPLKV